MDKPTIESADPRWKTLYKAGGVAPLITIAFYLSYIFIFAFGEPFPTTAEGWYSLIQRSRLLGLYYLNALDILSIALLGIMFVALYIALRQENESLVAIAAFFAFLGIPVFIVPRVAMLSLLPLSDRYMAAATDAQRLQTLAAGEALGSMGTATTQTMGFFFIAVAVLLISIVMLRSERFTKAAAYVGILASAVTVADDISLLLLPSIADVLMVVGGIFWIVWWIMISRGLFRLGKRT